MADNNAHPGVRSLLAKFENGESPITSPPSRGRSPVGSATPGSTRQLSRVRASFVTVDGVIQSNSGSPLRKTSGRSDSPGIFGPQINADEVEARRQNVISPTPAGSLSNSQTSVLDEATIEPRSEQAPARTAEPKEDSMVEAIRPAETAAPSKEPAPVKKEETASSAPKPRGSGVPAEKPAQKTVTKRPSNIHATKTNATTKPATTPSKSPTNTTTGKPSARDVAKERSDALARKPSRVSLNPAGRTATRTTRGATPSQDTQKTSPTNSQGGKPRTRSPTRPVRLPASATAPTQASSARLGTQGPSSPAGRTGTATLTLTRKPSTLKSATGAGQTRTTNGTTASVRRQSSRPSLPPQPAQERPSSRTSDAGSKPADGFLARMMRPTESSRSKTHDRPEAKAPPKASITTAKAPRSSMGRAPERSATQAKAKAAPLQPQKETSQAPSKEPKPQREEVKPTQTEQESEKENIEEPTPTIPEEPAAEEPKESVVELPKPEVSAAAVNDGIVNKQVETAKPEVTIEPTQESGAMPSEPVSEIVTMAPAETTTAIKDVPKAPSKPVDEAEAVEDPAELKDEAPKETPVGSDMKKAEDAPAEDVAQANDVEFSSEAQIEEPKEETKEALIDTAVEKAPVAGQETQKAEPEVPEISEPSKSLEKVPDVPKVAEDTTTPEASTKASEVAKDVTVPEHSVESEEPATKDSVPAVQNTTETKSDTVDIDFATLNLS